MVSFSIYVNARMNKILNGIKVTFVIKYSLKIIVSNSRS